MNKKFITAFFTIVALFSSIFVYGYWETLWTEFTSEEYPPATCPNDAVASGFIAAGRYADYIKLRCSFTGYNYGLDEWSQWISEEYPNNIASCSGVNQVVTGIDCRGRYCDDVSIRCTEIENVRKVDCRFSSWYSEEQAPFVAPDGYAITAVICNGKYCDNKRFQYCKLETIN